MSDACLACGNSEGNRLHIAREMMFGSKTEFEYLECQRCGSLQIREIPASLGEHCPQALYYSMKATPPPQRSRFRISLRRLYSRQWPSPASWNSLRELFALYYAEPHFAGWMRRCRARIDSKILDAGCGNGLLLLQMASDGFTNLVAVDPFIDGDKTLARGAVGLLKKGLNDVNGTFDIIMLHYSFEHLADPLDTPRTLDRSLNPHGTIPLRTPLAGLYGWRRYGTNWVQLDAPRHLFVTSEKAVYQLASQVDFGMRLVEYGSTDFQSWGSEQYEKGIPLNDSRSYSGGWDGLIFECSQIESFRQKATELNKAHDGDQGAFYLVRSKDNRTRNDRCA